MPYCNRQRKAHQIESIRRRFVQAEGLPLANLLSADDLQTLMQDRAAVDPVSPPF
jgi:hypothetical protein